MKVIAIKDAPVTNHRYWPDGSKQAYRKGDVFEADMHNIDGTLWSEVDAATRFLVVWHPTIGKLEVTAENFEDLEKWRSKRIDNILEDGDN